MTEYDRALARLEEVRASKSKRQEQLRDALANPDTSVAELVEAWRVAYPNRFKQAGSNE